MSTIVLTQKPVTIALKRKEPVVSIARGTQGPPGVPGPAGGQTIQRIAAHNIVAGRAVTVQGALAVYFDINNIAHAAGAVGIATNSALTGDVVNIQIVGECSDVGFSFAPGAPVFVTALSTLSNTPPAASSLLAIAGVATGVNSFVLRPLTIIR